MNSLQITDLFVTFDPGQPSEKRVLNGLNLTLEEGDFVCVLGSNGAGKSTLLRAIMGSAPYSGSIALEGMSIDKKRTYQRARLIGAVYQDPTLGTAPNLTVAENLLLSSRMKSFFNQKKTRAFLEQSKEDLSRFGFGLEKQMNTPCASLSGGMRQVLALYMATRFQPKLLLLDEHTAALDPRAAELVMETTGALLRGERKIPTLMVTHNLDFALRYGNRLVVLNEGVVALDVKGEEKASLTRETLLSSYGSVLSDRALFSLGSENA